MDKASRSGIAPVLDVPIFPNRQARVDNDVKLGAKKKPQRHRIDELHASSAYGILRISDEESKRKSLKMPPSNTTGIGNNFRIGGSMSSVESRCVHHSKHTVWNRCAVLDPCMIASSHYQMLL